MRPASITARRPGKLQRRLARLAAVLLSLGACIAAPAFAHGSHGTADGFVAGLLHPVTGLDHLLAMIAVGIWSAFLGRALAWQLPVAFPLVMVVGGALGIAGVPLPDVELGIALSVVVLGAAIAARWAAPTAAALSIIVVFAIFHGHAHGTELPSATEPQGYAAGFVLSTGLLHLAGIAIAQLALRRAVPGVLRACGAAIALAGFWFVGGSFGLG
jgi:urease accessory protein